MDNDRLTDPGPSGGGGYDAALLDHWLTGRTRVNARSRRGLPLSLVPLSLLPQGLSPIVKPLPAGAFELDWNARLPANQEYLLTGRSWSGSGPIARTEISTDGGRRWHPAIPRDPGTPAAWQRWEFRWRTPGPGSYTLRARATDVTGATQPATVSRNTFGYHFGGIAGHPVSTA